MRSAISDRWVEAPRVRPHVCAVCRRGGAEHGPYWESSFHYPDPVSGAELRVYQCQQCLVNVFRGPGSPFLAPVLEAQAAQTDAEAERDLADAAAKELREALEAANAQLGRGAPAAQLDPEDFAAKLAAALEARWGTPPDSWRARVGSKA